MTSVVDETRLRLMGLRLVAIVIGIVLAAACSSAPQCEPDLDTTPAATLCAWTDAPQNPLIAPPANLDIIADPTVIEPDDSPDGRWHLFAHALTAMYHYVSADGVAWTEVGKLPFSLGALRPYVFKEGAVYYLFFEQFLALDHSVIQVMESTDLATWSAPTTVLEPTFDWEKAFQTTVGNPFVVARDGEYWLYYSAAGVYLDDAGYSEPLNIGVARATDVHGPYVKQAQPIITPDAAVSWRNLGAGSIKLLDDRYAGRWTALENGIYRDDAGNSRSAIQVLESDDGVSWREVCPAPPLAPTDAGWKQSFVYAFDTTRRGDELRVYYNAREGWSNGVERIGMSSLSLPCGGPAPTR